MVTLQDMALQGSPWRVTVDLSNNNAQDIVIPKPIRTITNPQQNYGTHEAVTILGWTISALSAGDVGTVVISSQDPAIVEGTITDDEIHTHRWAASSYIQESVTPVYINLRGGQYHPTPSNGATLRVDPNNVSAGTLCIWGIYGQSDAQSIDSVTGSPVDRS